MHIYIYIHTFFTEFSWSYPTQCIMFLLKTIYCKISSPVPGMENLLSYCWPQVS